MSWRAFATLKSRPTLEIGVRSGYGWVGIVVGWVVCAACVRDDCSAAVTIVWDGEVGAATLSSDGVSGWTSEYIVDLGVFHGGFEPTLSNIGEWGMNWTSLGITGYEPAPGGSSGDANFSGSILLEDNNVFEVGAQVYMWVRDSVTISGYGQWLLVTDDDASAGDDWLIPDVSLSGQTTDAVTWSLFCNAVEQTVVFGGIEAGGTGGDWAAASTEWCYQTHWVPEPSGTGAVLLPLAFGMTITRRRREMRSACSRSTEA